MIFIQGGNGFVGSGFVRVLRESGREFAIITRDNYHSFMGRSCDVFINANGNSKKFLAREDPKREFQESVASVRNSLSDFKFGAYVFLSTSDVYPDCSHPDLTREERPIDVAGQSTYGLHKYLAEQCVQNGAERFLIVRQGGFVGPGLKKNVVYDILFGDRLWVHPDSCFQFIHTDYSARAILSLVDAGIGNRVVNLTGLGTISASQIMSVAQRAVPSPQNVAPLRYEISTDVAARWVELPQTAETVIAFIRSLRLDVNKTEPR